MHNIDVRQGNNIALFIILQSNIATTTKRGKKKEHKIVSKIRGEQTLLGESFCNIGAHFYLKP